MMRILSIVAVAAVCFLTAPVVATDPVGTTFTYQGRLMLDGEPVVGATDLVFRLYTLDNGGVLLGTLVADNFMIGDDGLFTIDLDFGDGIFTGAPRWLEIGINGVTLSPRQPILPTPHAMIATTAANVPTKAVMGVYTGITGVGTLDSLNVSGSVGIGTESPGAKLEVISSSLPIRGIRTGTTGTFPGIHGESHSSAGISAGVRGVMANSTPGSNSAGVWGNNEGTTNNGHGVRGTHQGGGNGVFGESISGTGVRGISETSTGVWGTGMIGVAGTAASADSGYGGSFSGAGFFGSGRGLISWGEAHLLSWVGVGNLDPQVRLHVTGGSNVQLDGGGFILAGNLNSTNLVLDNNEIMARNNGQTANLHLNKFGGDVIVGTFSNGSGRLVTPVLQITGGSDLSENFDIAEIGELSPQPGMVVCIDPANPGKLVSSTIAYDRTVAGVISGANGIRSGMIMGQEGSEADGAHPVALIGRVYVMADATGPGSAIEPGDLLTTSDLPGHAMKVHDYARAQGAIIGKAMTGLAQGERGMVLVLVSLQ